MTRLRLGSNSTTLTLPSDICDNFLRSWYPVRITLFEWVLMKIRAEDCWSKKMYLQRLTYWALWPPKEGVQHAITCVISCRGFSHRPRTKNYQHAQVTATWGTIVHCYWDTHSSSSHTRLGNHMQFSTTCLATASDELIVPPPYLFASALDFDIHAQLWHIGHNSLSKIAIEFQSLLFLIRTWWQDLPWPQSGSVSTS